MKLFFQDKNLQETLIVESDNREDIVKRINSFLSDKNIEPHYFRMYQENKRMIIDYGSHSEFFVIDGANL